MIKQYFPDRHIGPDKVDQAKMLEFIGATGLDELINQTLPKSILKGRKLQIEEGMSEFSYIKRIREIGSKNKVFRSYIGLGYHGTITLPVIQRNILENPSWYTSYTPYQAEISQGRLEALLNFQTMVTGLTGMEVANASLLDESTSAAEAMIMLYGLRSRDAVREGRNKFFIDIKVFPQTLSVVKARAIPLGIEIIVEDYRNFEPGNNFFGCLLQYPNLDGKIIDYSEFISKMHSKDVLVSVAADLMSLVLLTPPGEWDADVVVGSSQRFGVPLGYGGPHAAFFATREKYKRNIPGRIIGVSVDRHGNPALRMALQTREQHIKREKATSNICTAQALLATMAGMYAIYHGREGLINIAGNIHQSTVLLRKKLIEMGYEELNVEFFDTLNIVVPAGKLISNLRQHALSKGINFRYIDDNTLGVSLDETVSIDDLNDILEVMALTVQKKFNRIDTSDFNSTIKIFNSRKSTFMNEAVFNRYHSETEMMRYIKLLERKDISLTHSMIPLGSCTMKLNAASELMAFLWPEFSSIHPFVPIDQAEGYHELFNELARDLKEITGFAEISFQPNSGAAGEYAGLMVIRAYHQSRGDSKRNIVLIPASAHGTNPASAVMAGMQVVVVDCDEFGNTNIESLKKLAEQNKDHLSAFMITYPSTHGVFEENIIEMIELIHSYGGQVYMDGANMNAQVGLTSPGLIGADVCHLNLHKTFAIPHGGGGPGMGPIGVAAHLVEFLPMHPLAPTGGVNGIDAVSAAPYGSASILTVSHAYIQMSGGEGLTMSSKIAILSANYLASKINPYFPVLYIGKNGRVGHEMIIDCRPLKQGTGISELDVAKRLMDYGYHAPTLSFPVHGTLMIEPTESESLYELDRFLDALISIHGEIMEIKDGKADPVNNVLKNAPHTAIEVTSDEWPHPYSRQKAAYPRPWIKENKFWPSVARLDDAYGDRNLVCTCEPLEAYRI
jgi:glycine dehydrogenase